VPKSGANNGGVVDEEDARSDKASDREGEDEVSRCPSRERGGVCGAIDKAGVNVRLASS
jgi:hypothetical protein